MTTTKAKAKAPPNVETSKPLPLAPSAANTFEYVCIPRPVLKYPPILHRGDKDAKSQHNVTAFEWELLSSITMYGRAEMVRWRHEDASAAAREKAAKHRRKIAAGEYQNDDDEAEVEVLELQLAGIDSAEISKAAKAAVHARFGKNAADAYERAENEWQPPAKALVVKVRPAQLLQRAGLRSDGGKHFARLKHGLDRLMQPIGQFTPLLRRWAILQSGKLRLDINWFWLPLGNYGKVPVPVPRGSVQLAVYLFACGSDQRGETRFNLISRTELCARVGIKGRWPQERAKQLTGTMAANNEHLREWREQHQQVSHDLPEAFVIDLLRDDHIRIRFVTEEEAGERAAQPVVVEPVVAPQSTPQVKRARPPREEPVAEVAAADDEDDEFELALRRAAWAEDKAERKAERARHANAEPMLNQVRKRLRM